MTGFCFKRGNESSGSMKDCEFHEYLRYYQLVKKDCVPWNQKHLVLSERTARDSARMFTEEVVTFTLEIVVCRTLWYQHAGTIDLCSNAVGRLSLSLSLSSPQWLRTDPLFLSSLYPMISGSATTMAAQQNTGSNPPITPAPPPSIYTSLFHPLHLFFHMKNHPTPSYIFLKRVL